jgi:hypothetical protein
MLIFGLGLPGFGLVLLVLALTNFLGEAVGAHHAVLISYNIVGISVSYVIPALVLVGLIAACFIEPEMGFASLLMFIPGVIVWLFVASLVFAVPSSFVAKAACEAGYTTAGPIAMRTIPALGITERFVDDDQKIVCAPKGGLNW